MYYDIMVCAHIIIISNCDITVDIPHNFITHCDVILCNGTKSSVQQDNPTKVNTHRHILLLILVISISQGYDVHMKTVHSRA